MNEYHYGINVFLKYTSDTIIGTPRNSYTKQNGGYKHGGNGFGRQRLTERTGAYKDRTIREDETPGNKSTINVMEKLGNGTHGEQKHNRTVQGCEKNKAQISLIIHRNEKKRIIYF